MSKKQQTQSQSTTKNLLAGGLAGAFEASVMYPTEHVKTQLQLASRSKGATGGVQYKGVVDCARQIVSQRGVFALYSGCSTLIVGSIPKAGIRFAAFNQFKKLLADDKGKMTPQRNMLAGLGAGVCEAIFAVTPTESIKTALIHDGNSPNPKYKGLIHGVSTMIKEGGFGSIYKGVVPTMLKQGGNQAARFSCYEFLKAQLGADKRALAAWETTAAGAVAGAVSVYATMPFDVVKSRMQGLDSARYAGTLDCTKQVIANDGVIALWRGTTPRLGRVMCSSAIIFSSYEFIMAQILAVFPDKR